MAKTPATASEAWDLDMQPTAVGTNLPSEKLRGVVSKPLRFAVIPKLRKGRGDVRGFKKKAEELYLSPMSSIYILKILSMIFIMVN